MENFSLQLLLSRTAAKSFRISFGGAPIVRGPTLNRSQRPSMTVAQTEIETATVPSALLGADAKRGYKGNLLFVGQFAKPRNV
jgi:hypothetical protein